MMSSEWTIFFHNRCGRYIRLFDDNRRAKREGDTYDHGLVFSDRPLHVGELFQLKIEEIESKWAGSLVCLYDSVIIRNKPSKINCHIYIYIYTRLQRIYHIIYIYIYIYMHISSEIPSPTLSSCFLTTCISILLVY